MGLCFSAYDDPSLKEALADMKTAERHKDAMQGIFDAKLAMTRIRDGITNRQSKSRPAVDGQARGEMSLQVLPDEMPAEVMSEAKRILKENVAGLWEDSDSNGNGVLEQSETEALIHRYLTKSLETGEKSVDVSLDQSIEVTLDSMKSQLDPAQIDAVRAQLKERFTAMKPNILAELKRIHGELLQPKECSAIAEELLQKMDLDGDGKVVRSEFEDAFIEAVTGIIGTDKLMTKIDLEQLQS
jgi:uncharacterized protein (DUF2267 family)